MALPKIINDIESRVKDTGDTLTGDLVFKKVNNGKSKIYKNHSDTADYGLSLLDETQDGLNTARLILCANPDRDNLTFLLNGTSYLLYGEHNKPTLAGGKITLNGDLSGAGTFDNTNNLTLTATVADDSHNHIISNIDNLQSALDNRFNIGEAGTSIPNGVDLNSYTTIGNYYSTSSSVSTTLLNCPITGSGFRLVVMRGYNSSVPIQLIFAYGSNLQYRAYESSSSRWSNWVNLTNHVASKLGTARKINSVSFDGSKDISFKGSYNTATNAASLPAGLSYIELPATAVSTGDPTYGVCLTAAISNVRTFQIGINNSGAIWTRAAHTNHTSTNVPGYSDWKQVWRSGDKVTAPTGTDYTTVRTRNIAANTSLSTPANGNVFLVYT